MDVPLKVVVVPGADNLTDRVATIGAQVVQRVIVAEVDERQDSVVGEVEGDELVVGYIKALEEWLVAQVEVGEVIPFQVNECELTGAIEVERRQIVVGSVKVRQVVAIVYYEFCHVVVATEERLEVGQPLDIKLRNLVGVDVDVFELFKTDEADE